MCIGVPESVKNLSARLIGNRDLPLEGPSGLWVHLYGQEGQRGVEKGEVRRGLLVRIPPPGHPLGSETVPPSAAAPKLGAVA